MRHVELRYLWVQEVVKEGRIKVRKVPGLENPADHLTKPISGLEMKVALGSVGGDLQNGDG